jgi:transcriptional regulator with XRE-family HTH domain
VKALKQKKIGPMETLGDRVAKARMEKGWEQKDLVKQVRKINPRLKTAASTISSIERGFSEKPTIIVELAQALGVTENWLKTGKPPKERTNQAITERNTEEALTAVFAALLGVLQAMKFSAEEADEIAAYVRGVAEEPLTGEPPEEFARARRILAASLTHKYLISKGVKISRA